MADDGRIRLDKWLWQARFVKSRALAVEWIEAGRVRVNGLKIDKPGRAIGPGDVLTFAIAGEVRVLRVLACGTRRGPAPEAATLYAALEIPAAGAPFAAP